MRGSCDSFILYRCNKMVFSCRGAAAEGSSEEPRVREEPMQPCARGAAMAAAGGERGREGARGALRAAAMLGD